jgi:hypothetical protein
MGRAGFNGWLQNQFCQFTKSEHRMTMLIMVNICLKKGTFDNKDEYRSI